MVCSSNFGKGSILLAILALVYGVLLVLLLVLQKVDKRVLCILQINRRVTVHVWGRNEYCTKFHVLLLLVVLGHSL